MHDMSKAGAVSSTCQRASDFVVSCCMYCLLSATNVCVFLGPGENQQLRRSRGTIKSNSSNDM